MSATKMRPRHVSTEPASARGRRTLDDTACHCDQQEPKGQLAKKLVTERSSNPDGLKVSTGVKRQRRQLAAGTIRKTEVRGGIMTHSLIQQGAGEARGDD